MKVNLYIQMFLKYDRTTYAPLLSLAQGKPEYNKSLKLYSWYFPANKIKDLRKVLGRGLEADNILELIESFNQSYESLRVPGYKGKGFVDVREFPKIYQVKTVINKKETTFTVDKLVVKELWKIMLSYPLKKPIRTRTVAERYINALGITRFHRSTGTFDFDKFFGSRKDYFLFYYAVKVLEHFGLVRHHKSGKIERLKDAWISEGRLY